MTKIILEDPVLDAEDPHTRLFLLAEYWKGETEKAREKIADLTAQLAAWEKRDHELAKVFKEVLRISDRKHDAWDKAHELLDAPIEQDDPDRPVKPHRSGGGHWVGKP